MEQILFFGTKRINVKSVKKMFYISRLLISENLEMLQNLRFDPEVD